MRRWLLEDALIAIPLHDPLPCPPIPVADKFFKPDDPSFPPMASEAAARTSQRVSAIAQSLRRRKAAVARQRRSPACHQVEIFGLRNLYDSMSRWESASFAAKASAHRPRKQQHASRINSKFKKPGC
jgi:hypothetical protein